MFKDFDITDEDTLDKVFTFIKILVFLILFGVAVYGLIQVVRSNDLFPVTGKVVNLHSEPSSDYVAIQLPDGSEKSFEVYGRDYVLLEDGKVCTFNLTRSGKLALSVDCSAK